MVIARSLPLKAPIGPTAWVLAMAVRTSSSARPIEASATDRLFSAIDGDLAYAFDLRNPPRAHAISGIVEHARRQVAGRERQNHDRRCRGVGFAERRR